MERRKVKINALVLLVILCGLVKIAFADEYTRNAELMEQLETGQLLCAEMPRDRECLFSIEDTDLTLPCYDTDGAHWQKTVDKKNSAAIIPFMDGTILIADHCNQGFAVLRDVVPFGTHAYLTDSHGTATYECVELIPDGVNNGDYLSEPGGRSVAWDFPCSLITYTCNEGKDADTITIAIWYRVPKEI